MSEPQPEHVDTGRPRPRAGRMSVTSGVPVLSDLSGVRVIDTPASLVRSPSDLASLVLSAAGIVAVLVLSVYAHATTLGVTEDVQSITSFLNQVLQVGVSVLNGLVSFVLPLWVIVELLIGRHVRQAIEGLATGLAGFAVGQGAIWALEHFGTHALTQSLTITVNEQHVIALSAYAVAFAAMLTMVGPRSRRSSLRWSWNLLWAALGVQVIAGSLTLPGAIVTVLLGRLVGAAGRYVIGVRTERAYGKHLVGAVRQAGIEPATIVRVHDETTASDPAETNHASTAVNAMRDVSDSTARALDRHSDNRVYAVFDDQGRRFDAVVLDGDRQVLGFVAQTWEALRLRGIERRGAYSLRQATERAALASYAAAEAGVATPQLQGVGSAADSMLLLFDHPAAAICLRDLEPDAISDECLARAWQSLATAHGSSLAHRSITADAILIGPETAQGREVWITGWQQGDIAAPELAIRMDVAQLLAVLALKVGPRRAVASAASVLSNDELTAVAPLLQTVVLARDTREEAKAKKDVLKQLRAELVDLLPEVEGVETMRLARFSWRTVAMATLAIVAVWVILTTLNFSQIAEAVSEANLVWVVVAFVIGLFTLVGAAMTMVAFAPIKVPWWDSILVQTAGCFANLVAPGVVGHAGINYMYFAKHKVKSSLALATVALVQVSIFITTVLLLVIISLVSGDSSALNSVPTTAVLVIVALIVVVGIALAIPVVRTWVWDKVGPTLLQVWPRMVWVLGQPWRVIVGLGGNVVNTLASLIAFWACLEAFGQHSLSITDIAIVYLVGNTLGTAVPTPGGLGAVEAAFAGGLTTLGVPVAVAASVAVLFRLVTYWARVPLGWAAMRWLQRRGEV